MKRGRKRDELDASGLHRLRIEIKKLRYAAEFFSSLYERRAVRSYTAALAELQDLLGTLNDAATVDRLCEALRTAHDAAADHEAVGAVRGWAAAIAHDHLARLPQTWKRFRDAEPFW
jgi:CHAD domain-containing protein